MNKKKIHQRQGQITSCGQLVVISGPSGGGKTSICAELTRHHKVRKSVSVTTRPPRPQEIKGRDYLFVSEQEFDKLVREGKFVEHTSYAGYRYGTLVEPLEEALKQGLIYLLEIDVHGAMEIVKKFPGAITIFIMPPDRQILENRLRGRNTDKEHELGKRLGVVDTELGYASRYKHCVVNDTLERAVAEIRRILGL